MNSKELYLTKVKEELKKELSYSSDMAVPKIKKIVVNSGFGTKRDNKEYVRELKSDLTTITGQSPKEGRAGVSISNFKLRKGNLIGYSVTLRGDRMWDFYEKLINIVLPRVKDFRGVSKKAFDKAGNYSIGISEHTIFPEIDVNKVQFIKPLQLTIVTSAHDSNESRLLLEKLEMPFSK